MKAKTNIEYAQAGLDRRIAAFFIDFILFSGIGSIPIAILHSSKMNRNFILDDNVLGPFYFVGLYVFFFARDYWDGRGPGKRILNLTVLSKKMEPLGIWLHLGRNLGWLLWPLEIVYLVFEKDKVRLMDRILNSDVYFRHQVKKNPPNL
jgi:uncharacterized RDD family membrane protein YckC